MALAESHFSIKCSRSAICKQACMALAESHFCIVVTSEMLAGRRPDFVRKMRLSERNPNLFGFPSVSILSKDHASTSQRCAAWSEKCHQQVPRRGTLFAGKFLFEARAALLAVTKLRGPSALLHGLSYKVGSSTHHCVFDAKYNSKHRFLQVPQLSSWDSWFQVGLLRLCFGPF